jgi:hypothetical protein
MKVDAPEAADSIKYLSDRLKGVDAQIVTQKIKDLDTAIDRDLVKAADAGATTLQKLEMQQKLTSAALDDMSKTHTPEAAAAVVILTARLNQLNDAIVQVKGWDATKKVMDDLANTIDKKLAVAAIDGTTALQKLTIQHDALRTAMEKLIVEGKKGTAEYKNLEDQYNATTDAIKQQTIAMQFQTGVADFLADALGTAMAGGLHQAAQQKSKSAKIEAAEMLVRAGVFAIFGDFAHAGAALEAAAGFAGLALAWGAIAAETGGGDGGSAVSVPTPSTAGASAGSGLTTAQAASASSSSGSSQIPADVSIYLTGPGFNALNPKVQEVVWGAQQQAEQRFGPNTRVRVQPTAPGGGN